jgi:hypothetical protein
MLLLCGARDEVVPRAHMHTLWELVAKRGERATKDGSKGADYTNGLERARFKEFELGTHSKSVLSLISLR